MPAGNLLIHGRRIPSDQLTPVLAYRRLVAPDERDAPSFLLESVEQGGAVGRFSMLGARPSMEVIARGNQVEVLREGAAVERFESPNPLMVPRQLGSGWNCMRSGSVPEAFHGGWVGFVGFDAVRWLEPGALPFASAPRDDRGLPDMHLGMYRRVAVFDHALRVVDCIAAEPLDMHGSEKAARAAADAAIDQTIAMMLHPGAPLATGEIALDLHAAPSPPMAGSMTQAQFEQAVRRAKEAIAAGDAFQIVLSQRLQRTTHIDPFEVYRALRIVNPSPYQVYLQARDCILVASSPEIACRVRGRTVTNRPLAGTRPRGASPEQDAQLERELLADPKERAEHVMLVDLGRNDLGRVCRPGSVAVGELMVIERYSHVMHIVSQVRGVLQDRYDIWDLLMACFPAGTVSGAPKIRACQRLNQLEPVARGPYCGSFFRLDSDGSFDSNLLIRSIMVRGNRLRVHGGCGIVADSDPGQEAAELGWKVQPLLQALV
jgi:anthranilate synthase component 1